MAEQSPGSGDTLSDVIIGLCRRWLEYLREVVTLEAFVSAPNNAHAQYILCDHAQQTSQDFDHVSGKVVDFSPDIYRLG